MPSFKRVGPECLTCVININSRKENGWLTEQNLAKLARSFSKLFDNKPGPIFLSLSFKNGFRKDLFQKIESHFSRLGAFIEVGLEFSPSNASSIFFKLPHANHTIVIFNHNPNWTTPFFLNKLNRHPLPVTILQYVTLDSAENALEKYRSWAKTYSRLEIVLHPAEAESSSGENDFTLDMIKNEGYFEPEDLRAFDFQKPEKVRINYRYSDVDLSPREIKLRGLNRFKGFQCLAGQIHIVINETGEVYPSSCGHLPQLSRKLGDFQFVSHKFICPADICTKSDDILITKLDLSESQVSLPQT